MRKSLAWLLVVCLLLPGCASRSVPPIGAGGQPFKPESDARALWAKAEKEEEALLKKAKAYDDPLLEESGLVISQPGDGDNRRRHDRKPDALPKDHRGER